ncbi:MAG: hypothetical protein ACRD2U_05195 [Terriglobales bacterium]
MKSLPRDHRDRDTLLVTQLAAGVSILAFMIYLRHGSLLLYGDAVAHINIARRVFDSKTPGLLQLGTVWLPLPHLLMVPFLVSKVFWQTGIGGSIPSMVAFVLGVSGIFRLVGSALRFHSEGSGTARVAPWFAALIYGANPNLLYLQSTAMTESLYLALFIWAVVHFADFVEVRKQSEGRKAARFSRVRSPRSLLKSGLCVAGACLTRYDGWFLAAIMCAALFVFLSRTPQAERHWYAGLRKFVLLAAAAPALWLAYNAVIYRNPLEFANGPYSARAIEQKTATPGNPSHPGANNPAVAFSFFLKSAELNVAPVSIVQRLWVALLLLGTAMTLLFDRRMWPLLLLLAPVPFYMLSISYKGVPIFLPDWWPHSYYNLRYGLQLLPAIAVFVALFTHFAMGLAISRKQKTAIGLAVLSLVAGSYIFLWYQRPVCFREAWVNSRARIALETALAQNLRKLPEGSTLLMYVGDHAGAIQDAGIPFSRVINEGNHRPWKKPSDPDGLWERALANPQMYADYVVASEGDQVAKQVQKINLTSMVVIHTAGEPEVTIYWTHHQEQ